MTELGTSRRLLATLHYLHSGRAGTADDIAAHVGVSARTAFRYLAALREAGVPCAFDEETKTHYLRPGYFMPPVSLTLEEALAIVTLAEDAGRREQVPFMGAAWDAALKIRGQLPARVQDELDSVEPGMHLDLARTESADGVRDVYERVRMAIATRRALDCAYESNRAAPDEGVGDAPFRFEPYTLYFGQRAWYAIGHHRGRGEVRTLRLSRFTRVEPTDVPYAVDPDFSLRDYFGSAWRMIRGAKRYEVAVAFDASFADTVAETLWHPTQDVEHRPDGSILFRCTVDGLDEIVWWVLSMGPHAVVEEPPELAARVAELAAAVVARSARP